eukprot:GHVT01077533.1.p2 GENE.GHVT01077533.1~~GHVT01077533.1.p2  ORF type:complete len:127 (+),score=22.41 GHVT01077533.1:392-772(+)
MKRSDSLSFKSAMAHVVEAPPSASPRSKSPAASLGNETFIIGVTGGTASGKTSVTQRIVTCLGSCRISLITLDNFYRTMPAGSDPSTYNFDHPNAFDWDLLYNCISVNIPTAILACCSMGRLALPN